MSKVLIENERKQKSFDSKINCLNLIRLLAAIEVLLGHVFVHLNVKIPIVLNYIFAFFPGVPIFFTLSGYLIWLSLERTKTCKQYFSKRFFRIFPELWVGVLIEIIVMLCIYDYAVPVKDIILFTFTQSTFLQFWTPDSLKGYGCGCPNGSLWTICTLIQFYIVVFFVFKFLHKKSNIRWVITGILSFVFPMIIRYMNKFGVPEIISKISEQTILNYFWIFFIGILCAEKRELIIPFLKRFWWIFLIVLAGYIFVPTPMVFPNYDIIRTLLAFCCWVGFSYMFPILNIKIDISYGLYIYHMTVVNFLITYGKVENYIWIIVALIASIVLAIISTLTVGKFSKILSNKLVNKEK